MFILLSFQSSLLEKIFPERSENIYDFRIFQGYNTMQQIRIYYKAVPLFNIFFSPLISTSNDPSEIKETCLWG
jgi:hypothetical protein